MTEHRRIPEVERLEVRDMPTVLGPALVAPPFHLGATHADALPQVAVLASITPSVAGASPVTRDVVSPTAGSEHGQPFAAVWQQSPAALFAGVGERSDTVTTDWTQAHTLRPDTATDSVTAPAQDARATGAALAPAPQQTPTIAGVLRYAWRSVNCHRVNDRDDVVQQVCLEWLLLAATMLTTYDDVRRIVSRVLNRAYRRLQKQQLALELLDVPVHADPVEDTFRDMELDRDLGMKDLTDREWQVVQLRRQGYTFTEIGRRMGMPKQRVSEQFAAALSRLQQRYCKTKVEGRRLKVDG
jgi:DNA-directed RNA polymerase specialized sigma24 family protein